MRGRITFTNPATQSGIIFAADQVRYRFRVSEWQGPNTPPRNAEVEFAVMAGDAVKVRPFTPTTQSEVEEPAPFLPDILTATFVPPAAVESDLSPEQAFEVGVPTQLLPIQEPVVKPAATPFVATAFATSPPAKLLYPVDVEHPSHPAWKLYLIGFGATLALVIIGLIVTSL